MSSGARRLLLSLALGLAPATGAGQGTASGQMVIEVGPLRNSAGQVIVAVFNQEDGYPLDLDKALILRRIPATSDRVRVALSLPFGAYAVAAIHDENGNNTLDTNWIGIPREGVSSSNNAKGRFGPPSFEDASLSFGGDAQVVPMRMAYL